MNLHNYKSVLKLSLIFVFLSFYIFTNVIFCQNVAPVSTTQVGGKFTGTVTIGLSCATPDAKICYTTDGSIPTENSAQYTDPLTFSSNTPLRARAFANALLPSNILTNSYLFDITHSFPVVSLVFENADFFDPLIGIYPNFLLDLTAKTNIELFETNSQTAAFNQYVETEIQGTASALTPQKSLDIKPKAALGGATVNYKIFPDLPYTQYKRFVLRNAGQDWNIMMFRDEFVTSLVGNLQDLGGLITKPNLDLQAGRPSVVYYNGQYWGIHNIRERMNRNYVEQHNNLAAGTFDMIENFSEALSGDSIEWFAFDLFLRNNSFQDDGLFNQIKQKIDYQNFLDYCIVNIYSDNQDWPGNNVRRYKERKPNGKWRWISFDFDYTMGLYQPGAWNTGDASPDALGRILNPFSQNWPNPEWATLLFRRCWDNAGFRRDFANRTADFMNTIYKSTRVSARLDEFKNQYQPEIAQHFNRWTNGYYEPFWLENIEKTRRFGNERPQYMRQYVDAALPEVFGTAGITLEASPLAGGKIRINTITLSEAQYPWKGTYFAGIKIPVKAIANPGYVFTGWSDPSLGTADSVSVTLLGTKTLTAKFSTINNNGGGGGVTACAPNSQFPWLEYIKTVKLGTYTRESSKETYTKVAGIAQTLTVGTSYPIALTAGYSYETFDEYWRVWIDNNRDGILLDNEIAFQAIGARPAFSNLATKEVSGTVLIPNGTTSGPALMRVGMKRGAYPTPCENVPYGEFEDYTLQLEAGSGGGSVNPPVPTCASKSEFPWHEWIAGVKVGLFIKNSLKDTYSNFTNLTANAGRGKTIPVSLKTGFSYVTYQEYWKIWIDYNQDGVFDEQTETAFQSAAVMPPLGTPIAETTGSFVVPNTALLGRTKMRISMKQGEFPRPCEVFTYGEVEDYSIIINNDTNFIGSDNNGGSLQSGDTSYTNVTDLLENFTLFPNPAVETATINLKSLKNKAVQLRLYNIYGSIVKEWNIPSLQENLFEMNLDDVEIGSYFLHIVRENGKSLTKKLVVIKV
jgi:uncharacterized repeat protein (TIGR02543 family)